MKPSAQNTIFTDISFFFTKKAKITSSTTTYTNFTHTNETLVPKLNLDGIKTSENHATSISFSEIKTESSSKETKITFTGKFFPDHSTENDTDDDVKVDIKDVYKK
jgi:hypothetical protein